MNAVIFATLQRCPLRNSDLSEYVARLGPSVSFLRRSDQNQTVELLTSGNLGDAHAAYCRELYWLNRRVLERSQAPSYSVFDLKHQASTAPIRTANACGPGYYDEEPSL
jgi:hypothetical protein